MVNKTDVRTGRRCVFLLHAHLVFVTKYRYSVLAGYMMPTLEMLFESVCNDFEVELVEFDGEGDHVHLLVNYPPKVQLSKLVNSLKGVSSRKLKLHHPEIANRYFKSALWSPSYFAGSCGGASIDIVKKYIEQQETPH
ncbi:IS200/IS605 family transposase [Porticoccaceae bacterium]|nr:IS200/IS605 family transposase [Porticoccaceae bacterium]MDB2343136.1 IS200/IS605 family transposase [Porticoccaceae bacterium]